MYVCKDGNYVVGPRTTKVTEDPRQLTSKRDWVFRVQECSTVHEARKLLWDLYPDIYLRFARAFVYVRNRARRFGSQILANFRARQGRGTPCTVALTDFTAAPLSDQQGPCLLCGRSGIGKSAFARAHFKLPFVITTLDDFKKLDSDNDGIVLDDFTEWDKFTAAMLISLFNEQRSVSRRTWNGDNIPSRS